MSVNEDNTNTNDTTNNTNEEAVVKAERERVKAFNHRLACYGISEGKGTDKEDPTRTAAYTSDRGEVVKATSIAPDLSTSLRLNAPRNRAAILGHIAAGYKVGEQAEGTTVSKAGEKAGKARCKNVANTVKSLSLSLSGLTPDARDVLLSIILIEASRLTVVGEENTRRLVEEVPSMAYLSK